MLLVKEIVRAIYCEIKGTFQFSDTEAEVLEERWKGEKIKAKDVPLRSFISKRGTSLQYAMAMIYRLRQNEIKTYMGVYKGEDLYVEDIRANYYFVLYRENFFKWYIVDLEPQDPNHAVENPIHIKMEEFKKMKGKLWIYDPYDDHLGNLPFFDGFLKKPKFIIK